MRRRLIASVLVLLIAVSAAAYYSINHSVFKEPAPTLSPSILPTPLPTPSVPTRQNASVTGWGDRFTSYANMLTIESPGNITYETDSFTLKINISSDYWAINSVYYKADWLADYQCIYSVNYKPIIGEMCLAITANFTSVPDGSHSIFVIANYHDSSTQSSRVNFTVKT